MAKFSWQETKTGLKSLLNRNAIVAVLFNVAYMYSNTMKNGFRSSVVRISIGLPATYITVLATCFSLAGFIFRVPVGAIIDKRRNQLKWIMIIMNILRGVVYAFGYGKADSLTLAYLTYIFDGIVFCFCGVTGPALMAVSIDRKAMGSGYSIYMGLATLVTGSAKSLGLSIFKNQGQFAAGLVSGAIAVLSGIILIFLDGKTLGDSVRKEQKEDQKDSAKIGIKEVETAKKRKRLLAGFSLLALPFGIVTAFGSLDKTMASSFMPMLAAERAFDYLGAQTVTTSISGFLQIFVGILCDFVSPAAFVILAFVMKIAGQALVVTITGNEALFVLGFSMMNIVAWLAPCLRITAMKLLPYSEQGALSSTILMCQDIISMVGGLPAGWIADKFGYQAAFVYSGVLSALGLIIYIIVLARGRKTPEAPAAT